LKALSKDTLEVESHNWNISLQWFGSSSMRTMNVVRDLTGCWRCNSVAYNLRESIWSVALNIYISLQVASTSINQ
jgi:hypothetical protein